MALKITTYSYSFEEYTNIFKAGKISNICRVNPQEISGYREIHDNQNAYLLIYNQGYKIYESYGIIRREIHVLTVYVTV